MLFIKKESIIDFFDKLNKSKLSYVLIRNINRELPDSLIKGKDIDLLVKYSDKELIYNFLKKNGFKKVKHPHRKNIYLYGINKFEFFVNKEGLILDLNFSLVCRSLDKGQWLPIDQVIQNSAWQNKLFYSLSSNLNYWSLSKEDTFITLIVRSVFDKKKFDEGYIVGIEELVDVIDMSDVILKLNLIFFKYTDTLIEQIKIKSYSTIIDNYFKFNKY